MATSSRESPEECAFRQHSATLIHAIDSPDEFAWQLYASDIISYSVKSKAILPLLSKEQKNSILLSAVEGRIRAEPTVFHTFLQLLLANDDPFLRVLGEKLELTFEIPSNPHSQFDPQVTPQSQTTDLVSSLHPLHSTQPTPARDSLMKLHADYLRSVYSITELPAYDKWPPTKSTCFISLAAISMEGITREEIDEFTMATLHGDVDQVLKKKKPIKMEEILEAESGRKPRCVLLQGGPGVGKTTLSWEVCKQWGKGQLFQEYSTVVLLLLREERVQSARRVSDLFYYPDEEVQKRIAAEIVRTQGKDILVVLDGLDELPLKLQLDLSSSVIGRLISGTSLPLATILVTSRPSVFSMSQHLSRHVEVLGFTQQEVQDYARSVLPHKLLPGFKEYLSIHPHIHGMMYIPLNTAIVTEVYKHSQQSNKPTPTTATQLYTNFSRTLLLRYLDSHPDYKGHNVELNTFSDLPPAVLARFHKVCEIAYKGILDQQFVFSDLGQTFDHLGFMHSTTEIFAHKGALVSHCFLHLSVQEYLAAIHISQMSPDEQTKLFTDHHSRCNVLHGVWRFVFGLTHLKGFDLSVVQKCLCPLSKGRPEIDSRAVEWLFEAQDPQLLSILGETPIAFSTWSLQPSTSTALAYCIAQSKCVWSLELFSHYLDSEAAEILGRGVAEYGTFPTGRIDTIRGQIRPQDLRKFPSRMLHGVKGLYLKKDYAELADLNRSSLAEVVTSMPCLEILSLQGDLLRDLQSGRESPRSTSPKAQIVNLCMSLSKLDRLHILFLGGYSITVADARALKQLLLSTRSLKELDLSESYLPPDAIVPLSQGLCSNSTLKTLLLQQSKFNREAGEAFAFMLSVNQTLTTVDISSCDIDNKSAQYLAKALCHNKSVKELNISYNPLGDKGAVAIAKMLRKNTSLEQLTLIGWRWRSVSLAPTVSEAGVKALVDSLLVNSHLTKLRIRREHGAYLERLPTYDRVKHRIELTGWHYY